MQGTPPSALPRQAGGFRLVRELGRGGMGVVYEAQEIDSGRVVALKVLAADLSVSGEAFERFRREARLAASISDVRCVFVYGAHQVEDSPAIAMELVGGETLQDKITRGDAIPVETAVRWAIDVVDGLEAAHRAGVIHRDVKPSNCFVTPDGQVKIGDFGLSRTLERDIELTQSGQFLGSPLYASPEQIRGRTVDARSDQYSCAATLYALLAGRAPFSGSNVGEVLARILSEPPARLRATHPAIPRELERVVLRGMERDPEKRYRDLDAFRAALLPFSSRAAAAASIPRRLAAWALDWALLFFVSGSIGAMLQTSSNAISHEDERPWMAISLAAQLALGMLPFAYYALTEGLFAASIGKWFLGLRVASVGPGPALWVRVIPRAFLYEVVALILMVPPHLLAPDAMTYALSSAAIPVVTVLFRISTMRSRNGWRGPYELWTGTRVIQARLPFRNLRRLAPPPERHVEPRPEFADKLGEYRILGLVGETGSGPLLHARDERLERSVWIQFRHAGAVASEERRSLNRPARLRWLETLRSQGSVADVFESPGGCSLADLAQRGEPLEWAAGERALIALAEELERSASDLVAPRLWSANQVWLDRNWNVRLLDEPIPAGTADRDAVGLLGAAAEGLLGVGGARELPPDLPVHAESLMRSLTGAELPFPDLASARAALAASQTAAANVERRTRSAQITISTALLGLFALALFLLTLLIFEFLPHAAEVRGVLNELKSGHVATSRAELGRRGQGGSADDASSSTENGEVDVDLAPSGVPLDDESRRWRAIVLTYELNTGFGSMAAGSLEKDDPPLVREARALAPSPTEAEFLDARARIRAQRGEGVTPAEDQLPRFKPTDLGLVFVAVAVALWTLLALMSTVVWPGGLSFRLFGLSVRGPSGRRASRPFGIARVLVLALPLVVGYATAASIASPIVEKMGLRFTPAVIPAWVGWSLFVLVAAAHVAGLALSISDPSRGPVDRLFRSRIVPR